MPISKIFSLRNYIMKQIMKTNKQGIMQIPDKGKVDFGEMIIRENLFKKGIDPKTITSERQLDNILNTPTVSPKVKPKKSGEVIEVDFDKGRWKDIDPENLAYGGLAGMLGETDRMPLGEGKLSDWERFQQEKLMQKWQEYQQYLKNREIEEGQRPYLEERMGIGSGPVLEAADGGIAGMLGEPTYADGGRTGFKKGTKFNPKRRAVLKGLGALAALPVVGKFFKFAKPLAKTAKVADLTSVPIGNAAGMPAWFKPLVNKVIKEGDDVSKKAATGERQIVHKDVLPDGDEITVTQHLDNGNVDVSVSGAKNDYHLSKTGHGEQPYTISYVKGETVIGKNKKPIKVKDKMETDEGYSYSTGPDGTDVDIDFDVVNFTEKTTKHDTSVLKSYATGKKIKSTKKVQELEDMSPEADWDDNLPDFASGGRVPFGKGKIAKGLGELVQKLTKEKARTKRISGNLRFENQKRTSVGKPKLSEDEYNYYRELLDDEENYFVMGDETKEMLEAMVKEADAEMNYMHRLYKKGALDPTPGEQTRGRLKMLDDKAQSGVNMTTEEIEELKILSDMRDKLALGGRVSLSAGGLAGMLGE